MANIPNLQIEEVTNGGSGNDGADVWMELELFDGRNRQRIRLFVDREKYAYVLQALMHFGGMARAEFLKRNPSSESDGKIVGAYAPEIHDVISGLSAKDGIAILSFLSGEQHQPMNLSIAAKKGALRKIIEAAQGRLNELETPNLSSAKPTTH